MFFKLHDVLNISFFTHISTHTHTFTIPLCCLTVFVIKAEVNIHAKLYLNLTNLVWLSSQIGQVLGVCAIYMCVCVSVCARDHFNSKPGPQSVGEVMRRHSLHFEHFRFSYF